MTLLDNWKAILQNISAIAWSTYKALWALCIEPEQESFLDKGDSEVWKQKAQWVGMASIAITTSGIGNSMKLDSAATQIVPEVDTELHMKTERQKISKLENHKYSTCHSE